VAAGEEAPSSVTENPTRSLGDPLRATPEGLSFQPDATRWAAAPAGGRQR